MNKELIKDIFLLKLKLADRVIERMPDKVKDNIKEIETIAYEALKEAIGEEKLSKKEDTSCKKTQNINVE